MMFHTYIIYSTRTDRYYVGSCEDLQKRLNDHNAGHSGYTKTGKPWVLKWSQAFPTRSEAMQLEREIKLKKSRSYIERLVGVIG